MLPPLRLLVFPPKFLRGGPDGGSRFGVLGVAVLLVYLALSKSVLFPQLLNWLHAYGPA